LKHDEELRNQWGEMNRMNGSQVVEEALEGGGGDC
jgi:hypothetical protein